MCAALRTLGVFLPDEPETPHLTQRFPAAGTAGAPFCWRPRALSLGSGHAALETDLREAHFQPDAPARQFNRACSLINVVSYPPESAHCPLCDWWISGVDTQCWSFEQRRRLEPRCIMHTLECPRRKQLGMGGFGPAPPAAHALPVGAGSSAVSPAAASVSYFAQQREAWARLHDDELAAWDYDSGFEDGGVGDFEAGAADY
jgi:hypothetical protein